MTNDEKALIYDQCIRESDNLQRINSKLRSEYPIDMPIDKQHIIEENNKKINFLVQRLNSLFN